MRKPAYTTVAKAPIAIVGLAVEMPSGNYAKDNLDHHSFFEFLLQKGESYETIPPERFNIASWRGQGLGQVLPTEASFLKDVDMFDHVEFGIALKDATAMAAGTRKLIELSFLALLDSGIDYRGRNVGCFMSAVAFDILSVAEPDVYDVHGSFAGGPSMVANRISYHLDLLGPSIPVDTACSSSLTALHLAVSALRAGECESAIVGGCQLNHRLADWIQYSQGGILSAAGKCKPLDASADGFSRGEGAAVFVLKPLAKAVEDGDHIYAAILGTGVNSSGSAVPVNAPLAEAQSNAMHRAYADSGRHPSEADFVELHATGTAAGDPTEANWVGAEFFREGEVIVGSVKGNIGHLEIAAFLASLSKVCSIIDRNMIPPTVNLKTPNPAIKWSKYNLRAPIETEDLIIHSSFNRPLISICSFGIGGANGHVVLEGVPKDDSHRSNFAFEKKPILLLTGGLTPRSASINSETLGNFALSREETLPWLSAIHGRRARQMTWKSYAIVLPGQRKSPKFTQPSLSPRKKAPLVFVFAGQGPQHYQMGRELFEQYSVFRNSILDMDKMYEAATGISFLKMTGLFDSTLPPVDYPDIWPVHLLPSITMIQVALVDLLRSMEVRPDIILGHSAGETAMLYACGAASKEMVINLSIARSRTFAHMKDLDGSMAAISCSPETAVSILCEATHGEPRGKAELACYNAPEAVTVAGFESYVDKAVELAHSRGHFARKLKTSVPIHSSLMDAAGEQAKVLMSEVFSRYPGDHIPSITTYSTYSGTLHEGSFTPEYFWNNCRYPVRFSAVISEVLEKYPNASFLEISPHPVLSSYITALGAPASNVTCAMRRSKQTRCFDETLTYLDCLGRLAMMGHRCIDFVKLNGLTSLPTEPRFPLSYAFAKKRIPILPGSSRLVKRMMERRNGPLNYPGLCINALTHPNLAQHVIKGEPIMPAAGFIEMALEFGARTLWNVKFHSFLSLSASRPTPVQVLAEQHYWSVRSLVNHSVHEDRGDPPRAAHQLHADGCFTKDVPDSTLPKLNFQEIRSRMQQVDEKNFYRTLEVFANYGAIFRRVISIHSGFDEHLVVVRGLDRDLPDATRYVIHPAILDACLHVAVHPASTSNFDPTVYYLPSGVEVVLVHESLVGKTLPHTVYCYIKFNEWQPNGLLYDIVLANEDGERLCTLNNFRVDIHEHSISPTLSARYDLFHQPYGAMALKKLDGQATASDFPSYRQFRQCSNIQSIASKTKGALYDVLHHLVHVCNKKVVRILQIVNREDREDTLCTINANDTDEVIHLFPEIQAVHILGGKTFEQAQRAAALVSAGSFTFDWSEPPSLEAHLLFDVIICSEMSDILAVLRALHGLLIPGGTLVQVADKALSSSLDVGETASNARSGSLWSCYGVHENWRKAFDAMGYRLVDLSDVEGGVVVTAQKEPLSLFAHTSSSRYSNFSRPQVVSFKIGQEMFLQSAIKALSDTDAIWITAMEGSHGDAAIGFSRSLRRELGSCQVFAVIFHTSWGSEQEREKFVCALAQQPQLESEMIISEDGQVLVPRFIQSKPPNSPSRNFRDFWTVEESEVKLINKPLPHPGHVLVGICLLSKTYEGICSMAGHIVDSGDTTLVPGTLVLAIAPEVKANWAVVHQGAVITLSDDQDMSAAVFLAVPLVCGVLALGIESLNHLYRLRSNRILVNVDDQEITDIVLKFYHSLGLQHHRIRVEPGGSSVTELISLHIGEHDIVFTARASPLLNCFCAPHTHIFTVSSLHEMLFCNPWSIGNALNEVASFRLPQRQTIPHQQSPEALFKVDQLPSKRVHVFGPSKVYLLIGGIGSLGLHIALWLYQKGAKVIVLTSRSGRQSLINAKNCLALRILSFLESKQDLTLRLIASDASSEEDMRRLVDEMRTPIAGCFLLPVVLRDALFVNQTEANFQQVFAAKKSAFEAIEASIPIQSLDFLIAFSSISTFGNIGQTNYSSANTVLEGMTRKYSNAFTIVTPGIFDSNVATQENSRDRLQHLWSWAYTARELCLCLEDGILKLADGPFGLYIPHLKWDSVKREMGDSPLYSHLAEPTTVQPISVHSSEGYSLQSIICSVLDIQEDEFSPEVPLTSYGLDSLLSARLSVALRPMLNITQLQLMANVSLYDIQKRYASDLRCKLV